MVGFCVQYLIKFSRSAEKSIAKLPEKMRLKIIEEIVALKYDPKPHGYKKLKDRNDTYRIRVGDYRVVYEIHDGTLFITIIKIDHRKDVYR